ncbi:sugar-transfer associated ATP-grasp domain-containing protein [Dyella sp.]|jgi:hypothetical protein|uniref:sugar-transfer associated ATP-grasp domain-containing protein n=1 Tax=Dyella sp. TaxID=1869338 RepID=UPI002D76C217|nr:sugar-transfer associated ATP-grasp domain-containing protein [Dyella sp.]HET6432698.1 sugar-transfer associated ATP-grasp domain-containing protein [Dyella sp.]
MGEQGSVGAPGAATVSALCLPTVETGPAPQPATRRPQPKAGSWRAALHRATRTQRELAALMFDPALSRSYWPEQPRKGRLRILAELLGWLARTGEANRFYYVYGMDRRAVQRDDVMSFRRFQSLRNQLNLRLDLPPRNYNTVCVLRDKFLFGQFAASLGVPTPRSIAMLDGAQVRWLDGREAGPLEQLFDGTQPPVDGFCKRLDGMQGAGAFPLRIDAQGQPWIDDHPVTPEALRARLRGRFLWQHRLAQHAQLSALHAGAVNTLRLVSFCEHGRATVAYGALRVGTGSSCVDNWAAGGLIVAIDLQRGTLRGDGFFKPGYGGRTATHPDSGIRFDGYPLPQFAEAMALVKRLHEYLPGIHSVGWDVAITPTGPSIIEGNDDWDGVIQMVLEQGFRQRFVQTCRDALRPIGNASR